jgi:hypothetical protein
MGSVVSHPPPLLVTNLLKCIIIGQLNTRPFVASSATHLGRQVKVDMTLLKLESDQQWHLIAHVQDDVASKWRGFGKVLQVFQGKRERDGLLEDDVNAVVFLCVSGGFGLASIGSMISLGRGDAPSTFPDSPSWSSSCRLPFRWPFASCLQPGPHPPPLPPLVPPRIQLLLQGTLLVI